LVQVLPREYDAAYSADRRRLRQKKVRHAEFVAWYRALKDGQSCADCGGVFHHAAMEWDHLPGFVKLSDVATLVQKRKPATRPG